MINPDRNSTPVTHSVVSGQPPSKAVPAKDINEEINKIVSDQITSKYMTYHMDTRTKKITEILDTFESEFYTLLNNANTGQLVIDKKSLRQSLNRAKDQMKEAKELVLIGIDEKEKEDLLNRLDMSYFDDASVKIESVLSKIPDKESKPNESLEKDFVVVETSEQVSLNKQLGELLNLFESQIKDEAEGVINRLNEIKKSNKNDTDFQIAVTRIFHKVNNEIGKSQKAILKLEEKIQENTLAKRQLEGYLEREIQKNPSMNQQLLGKMGPEFKKNTDVKKSLLVKMKEEIVKGSNSIKTIGKEVSILEDLIVAATAPAVEIVGEEEFNIPVRERRGAFEELEPSTEEEPDTDDDIVVDFAPGFPTSYEHDKHIKEFEISVQALVVKYQSSINSEDKPQFENQLRKLTDKMKEQKTGNQMEEALKDIANLFKKYCPNSSIEIDQLMLTEFNRRLSIL